VLGLVMGMLPWLVSAQYCARQGASAYLELWALLLLLVAAATLTRSTSRATRGTLVVLAAVTGILALSMFYGCSMTAPSEQGLGTTMASGTYTTLKCLGYGVFGTATGWIITAVLCIAAIVVFTLARVRWKSAGRVFGFIGAALLTTLTFISGFLVFFGFAWCTSARLF
jgi:hypothetical protein